MTEKTEARDFISADSWWLFSAPDTMPANWGPSTHYKLANKPVHHAFQLKRTFLFDKIPKLIMHKYTVMRPTEKV